MNMANNSAETWRFFSINHFPPVINGRINVIEFLSASEDLVILVETLGTTFKPVKIDMQGNIDKINKKYKYDEHSCLLELMLHEKENGKPVAAEGVLWLNRALLFFELIFGEIVNHLQAKVHPSDVNMTKIYTNAYEGSVKKYHNWATRQLFNFMLKMSPNLPQMMKSFSVEDVQQFEAKLADFNVTLHLVRCKIDDFFKDNDVLST